MSLGEGISSLGPFATRKRLQEGWHGETGRGSGLKFVLVPARVGVLDSGFFLSPWAAAARTDQAFYIVATRLLRVKNMVNNAPTSFFV